MRRLTLLALVAVLAACGGKGTTSTETAGCTPVTAPATAPRTGTKPTTRLDPATAYDVVVETNCGTFTITLDQAQSPNTTASFVALVEAGYFDRTIFHRIVPGFVIQGGYLPSRREPLDTVQERYVRQMPPEFNPTPHDKGILSMARAADPGSATTSFFIVTARSQGLDNQYTVFGRVIDGLDVLERIEAVPVNGETPVERVDVTRVRVVRP